MTHTPQEIRDMARTNLYLRNGYFGGKSTAAGGKIVSTKYWTPDPIELEKEIARLQKEEAK